MPSIKLNNAPGGPDNRVVAAKFTTPWVAINYGGTPDKLWGPNLKRIKHTVPEGWEQDIGGVRVYHYRRRIETVDGVQKYYLDVRSWLPTGTKISGSIEISEAEGDFVDNDPYWLGAHESPEGSCLFSIVTSRGTSGRVKAFSIGKVKFETPWMGADYYVPGDVEFEVFSHKTVEKDAVALAFVSTPYGELPNQQRKIVFVYASSEKFYMTERIVEETPYAGYGDTDSYYAQVVVHVGLTRDGRKASLLHMRRWTSSVWEPDHAVDSGSDVRMEAVEEVFDFSTDTVQTSVTKILDETIPVLPVYQSWPTYPRAPVATILLALRGAMWAEVLGYDRDVGGFSIVVIKKTITGVLGVGDTVLHGASYPFDPYPTATLDCAMRLDVALVGRHARAIAQIDGTMDCTIYHGVVNFPIQEGHSYEPSYYRLYTSVGDVGISPGRSGTSSVALLSADIASADSEGHRPPPYARVVTPEFDTRLADDITQLGNSFLYNGTTVYAEGGEVLAHIGAGSQAYLFRCDSDGPIDSQVLPVNNFVEVYSLPGFPLAAYRTVTEVGEEGEMEETVYVRGQAPATRVTSDSWSDPVYWTEEHGIIRDDNTTVKFVEKDPETGELRLTSPVFGTTPFEPLPEEPQLPMTGLLDAFQSLFSLQEQRSVWRFEEWMYGGVSLLRAWR